MKAQKLSDASQTFPHPRAAALALLTGDYQISRRSGGFLGQVAVDPSPLSDKQTAWLDTLLDRAGLPELRASHGDKIGRQ
jgi:hypothetical protein